MKIIKWLYWLCFAIGAGLFVLNLFFNHTAIMVSSLLILLVAIVLYFVHANIKKKRDSIPQEDKRSNDLKKQREDSYKRIREAKKAKKNQKQ